MRMMRVSYGRSVLKGNRFTRALTHNRKRSHPVFHLGGDNNCTNINIFSANSDNAQWTHTHEKQLLGSEVNMPKEIIVSTILITYN